MSNRGENCEISETRFKAEHSSHIYIWNSVFTECWRHTPHRFREGEQAQGETLAVKLEAGNVDCRKVNEHCSLSTFKRCESVGWRSSTFCSGRGKNPDKIYPVPFTRLQPCIYLPHIGKNIDVKRVRALPSCADLDSQQYQFSWFRVPAYTHSCPITSRGQLSIMTFQLVFI